MSVRQNLVMIMNLLVVVFAPAGCEKPGHREQITMRKQNFNQTVELLAEMEESHEAKLERDWEVVEEMHEEKREDWEQSKAFFEELLEYDLNRWEHHEELNEEIWEEMMQGDMQNFEKTLPWVLY
jgi:hypothetical protein